MNPFIILIVLVGILTSIASKKNQAKAKQQKTAAQQREAVPPKPAAARGAQNRTSSPVSSAAPSKFPTPGPSRPAAASAQKSQAKQAASYGGTPRYTHVVQSTLEGGHTHTESSMSGEEACPPPKPVPAKQPAPGKAPAENTGALLNFQTNSVLQGVLYAEILGKPKALQRK